MAGRWYPMTMVCGPLLLGLLAGCAPGGSPAAAPAAQGGLPASSVGTVVAVRSAPPGALPALPGLPAEAVATRQSPVTEFIVRLDGAGTISVVQPGAPEFRPSDRVIIRPGPPARLARLDQPD
jgi:hypothetical protein